MQREDQRAANALRPYHFMPDVAPLALASVLVSSGRTQVICAVSQDESQPQWKKMQGIPGGWVTAEYNMLPYCTSPRKRRSAGGKVDGRSVEIQRLIGRSLRSVVDMEALGERTLWIDCDVLCADGGTRTASITGSAVALAIAVRRLMQQGVLASNPMRQLVAAISVGKLQGESLLDLCYEEDRDAEVDMNVVMTERGEYVEVQGSGEEAVFTAAEMNEMLGFASTGIRELIAAQRRVIEETCGRSGDKA